MSGLLSLAYARPVPPVRLLLLLRHAQTEDARPGRPDAGRRLTDAGLRQAREVGEHLRAAQIAIDHAVCSTAERAQQTLAALALTGATVEVTSRLYNAGGDEIIALIRGLPDSRRSVLLVGHAPGLPAVAYELADPSSSEEEAVGLIEGHYPAGTLAMLEVRGSWADLSEVRLVSVRLP